MAQDDLYNLEFLSLVAKITQEIDNHTGINDKTLAEFVIDLHDKSKTLGDFKAKLKEVGADFPESFIENIDRLVLTLHPKHKKKTFAGANGKAKTNGDNAPAEKDKQKRLFPGLALADQEWKPSISKDVLMKEVDELMAQCEASAKTSRPRPDRDSSPPPKRRRTSMSPPRRRSVSPPRGRGYERGSRGRGQLDERAVLYKIYDGRVQGLKEFGAFVQLEGIAGRVEGMFHWTISPLFSINTFSRVGAYLQYSGRCPRQLGGGPPQQRSTRQSQSNERRWKPHWSVHEGRRPDNWPRPYPPSSHQV
jgi:ATP-dependent RNA helicase DHX8/PRP22